jgi:hypothetical protein
MIFGKSGREILVRWRWIEVSGLKWLWKIVVSARSLATSLVSEEPSWSLPHYGEEQTLPTFRLGQLRP